MLFNNKIVHFILLHVYVSLLLTIIFFQREMAEYLYAQDWTPSTIKYLALALKNVPEAETSSGVVPSLTFVSFIYFVGSIPIWPKFIISYLKLKLNNDEV